ncbi:MAG: hypothetical protein MZV70_63160 [Desulfobacterales bacterium]|nr:hypothetical protein [Desulfobacterales bacterium]
MVAGRKPDRFQQPIAKGPTRLYVMTAFGTDQRRLLLLNGEQTNPKWSPGVFN